MRNALMFSAVVVSGLIGCGQHAPPPAKTPPIEERREIEVQAPGVKVDVEPGKGVEVDAPGVRIDTKEE